MLTLQLILGYEEFPDLDSVVFRSQGEVDTYLSSIFAVLGPRGRISDAGQSFICGCLAYDSDKRPTARQAFYHSWLQAPESDRKMFKRLEADNALSWKPQRVKFPVIEDLTGVPLSNDKRESALGDPPALLNMVSRHFVVDEPARTSQNHNTHSEESMSPQGSMPPTAFEARQVQAKRKGTASNADTVKRLRPSPG
jgi:serine/threonine protein kinase